MTVKSESELAQSCPTLSDPMDCSLPGSSIHGICQARVLEWGAIALTGKFGTRVWNEAGKRLIEFYQENTLLIANTLRTTQEKTLYMDITRWSTLKSD